MCRLFFFGSKKLCNVLKQFKISFPIFSFWEMVVQNFRIIWFFFRTKRCAMLWNGFRSKYDNFTIFSFLDIVDFVPNMCSKLGTSKIFANMIQKSQPVLPDKQLVRGNKFKSIQCRGAEPQVGVRGRSPPWTRGFQEAEPTYYTFFFLNSSKSPIHYEC